MLPLLQYASPDLTGSEMGALGGLFAMFAGALVFFLVIALIVSIGFYIYMSLALMKVAKRTNNGPAILAWIPLANIYLMSKIAKMTWLPILLVIGFFIPVINIIATIGFMIYFLMLMWKICEARSKPGWWAIISIVPFIGGIWSLIMWGILAWGKD